MEFDIVLMPRAENDLDEITWYIAKDDFQAAERFYEALVARALSLSQFPEMGRSVPEFKEPDIREISHGSYRVIYRVVKSLQQIQILRFWHTARGTPKF